MTEVRVRLREELTSSSADNAGKGQLLKGLGQGQQEGHKEEITLRMFVSSPLGLLISCRRLPVPFLCVGLIAARRFPVSLGSLYLDSIRSYLEAQVEMDKTICVALR